MRVAIVDYGMGNLLSVKNAFEFLGEAPVVVSEPAQLADCERVVVPGVGAFKDCLDTLRAGGFEQALRRFCLEDRKPFLGICLGLQALATEGLEGGSHAGLGLIPAVVERMQPAGGLAIPHIGWNRLHFNRRSPLFDGIAEQSDFYFVHSYALVPRDRSVVVAEVEYGGRHVAVVQAGNIFATQFHPEKSQEAGLKVLSNFLNWDGRAC